MKSRPLLIDALSDGAINLQSGQQLRFISTPLTFNGDQDENTTSSGDATTEKAPTSSVSKRNGKNPEQQINRNRPLSIAPLMEVVLSKHEGDVIFS